MNARHFTITFTNPETGKSITSTRGYVEQFVQYKDGSYRTMSAGLVVKLVMPGVGLVAANVGTVRVHFDASGEPIPDSTLLAGIHDGPHRAVRVPLSRDSVSGA
jgi:hypothetical protein